MCPSPVCVCVLAVERGCDKHAGQGDLRPGVGLRALVVRSWGGVRLVGREKEAQILASGVGSPI